MKQIKKYTLLFLILTTVFSCKKDDKDNNVPYTGVDIYIYSNNPSFVDVSVVGGWTYITGGVKGILLYRKSSSEFMAYERNCTYQPNNSCATIYVDSNDITATDTCCHSQFSIYDGSVLQGPASMSLRTYNTSFDGNVLHIYN